MANKLSRGFNTKNEKACGSDMLPTWKTVKEKLSHEGSILVYTSSFCTIIEHKETIVNVIFTIVVRQNIIYNYHVISKNVVQCPINVAPLT